MATVLCFSMTTAVMAAPSIDTEGAGSPSVDNSVVEDRKEELKNATTIEDIKGIIADEKVSSDVLVEVMADPEMQKLIAVIEANLNVEVKEVEVASEVDEVIDATRITLVGAALATVLVSGTEVRLEVSSVTTKETVTTVSFVGTSVQINIELAIDGVKAVNPKWPITITMAAPAGVKVDDTLRIAYFHDEEKPIVPIINSDGTITFTVEGFSTFAFGNMASQQDGDDATSGAINNDTPFVPKTADVPMFGMVAIAALASTVTAAHKVKESK